MRFSEFARALEALENTASRLQMYKLLGGLFDRADDEEMAPISYNKFPVRQKRFCPLSLTCETFGG
jgi:hypothetical protein